MSVDNTMDVDRNKQVRYKPKDYPQFKVVLFDNLKTQDIDKMVTVLGIAHAQMNMEQDQKGDTATMVSLLAEKGYIQEDSTDRLSQALRRLHINGLADDIEKLATQSDFGLFKVFLADKLDAVTMYRLATILGFSNAEIGRLGINIKGAKIISAMEKNATISESDVSGLFTLLGTLRLIQLKRSLEAECNKLP